MTTFLDALKKCSVEGCGKPIKARSMCSGHYQRWRTHGNPLAGGPRHYTDPEELFRARTVREGDCLMWTGGGSGGYGQMKVRGVQIYSHRYAWERAYGAIPDDMEVDHTCWNRACVEVTHLRLATVRQNRASLNGPTRTRKHNLPRNVYRNHRRFSVIIGSGGASLHFGTYDTPEEASEVADRERRALFGSFAGRGDHGHVIEYEGRTYVTPPIIENDDGKETRSIGEEA